MGERLFLCMAAISIQAVATMAAGTVTIDLASPDDGATVAAGDPISWSVTAAVSPGDNLGLALIVVDFVQAAANPESLDIPQADAAPAGMGGFEAPAGMGNPAGYGGTPLGNAGSLNLRQIGGAQNTFGVSGVTFGTDIDVDSGIGQGAAQTVATGMLMAPSTPGTYVFRIENGVANVLDAVNVPPAFSPVSVATITIGTASFTFSVGIVCVGDLDGDNDVDLSDLAVILSNFGLPSGATPEDGDLDGDEDVDLADLAQLLSNFGTICS